MTTTAAAADGPKVLVLLTGLSGAGKSTCADHLVSAQGFVEVSLARPLKLLCLDVLRAFVPGIVVGMDDMFDPAKKNVPLASHPHLIPRRCLQLLGTDICKAHLGANVWVDLAVRAVREAPSRRVVVSDVRFPEEHDALAKLAGDGWRVVTVRIVRPLAEAVAPTIDAASAAHVSETCGACIAVDATLVNDRTVADLLRQLDALL